MKLICYFLGLFTPAIIFLVLVAIALFAEWWVKWRDRG